MYSFDLDREVVAPLLTDDDAFNSNPMVGHIAYRLPTPGQLFQVPEDLFDNFYDMKFRIKVRVPLLVKSKTSSSFLDLECGQLSRCEVKYRRNFSPVLYSLNPPVVYKG